jgi:hypothetical protein
MTVLDFMVDRLLPRLTGQQTIMTGLEAVNEAVRVVGLELVRRQSDLAVADLELEFQAGDNSARLPDGFQGFVNHPAIDGRELTRASGTPQAGDGVPDSYQQVADTLFVFPAPGSAVTVTGKYKAMPTILEADDDMPWMGQFDGLLLDAAARLSVAGLSLLSDASFLAMVDRGVTAVLIPRQPPLPRRRPIQYF